MMLSYICFSYHAVLCESLYISIALSSSSMGLTGTGTWGFGVSERIGKKLFGTVSYLGGRGGEMGLWLVAGIGLRLG